MNTAFGEAYMARKLQFAEHEPAQDPGERPEMSRKLAQALLETKPLKTLHIDAGGYVLPPPRTGRSLQMTELSNETEALFTE